MTSTETIAVAKKYLIGNYTRYPVCLVRGEGSWVWDAEGNRYLDFFPGWGCGILGHCPPKVVEAVREQVGTLIHVPNTWYTEPQALLGKALSERTGWGGQCFFCNSGTEANEAAIKLARLHGKPKGKYKIVTFTDSFHGRTYGSLSATAQPKYHAGLEPITRPRFTPFTVAISFRWPIVSKPSSAFSFAVAALWSKCMLSRVVTPRRGQAAIIRLFRNRPIPFLWWAVAMYVLISAVAS